MISQRTVSTEPFSCSFVQSFFLQVSRSLLSSCLDLVKFEAVRRTKDLAKRERSLDLAQLANRLASAMHARTSNGDDPFTSAHGFPVIRDPHVISLTGQKFNLWRTGWPIFVRMNLLVRGNVKAYVEGSCAPAFQQGMELTGSCGTALWRAQRLSP